MIFLGGNKSNFRGRKVKKGQGSKERGKERGKEERSRKGKATKEEEEEAKKRGLTTLTIPVWSPTTVLRKLNRGSLR